MSLPNFVSAAGLDLLLEAVQAGLQHGNLANGVHLLLAEAVPTSLVETVYYFKFLYSVPFFTDSDPGDA